MNNEIDELTKRLWSITIDSFDQLHQIETTRIENNLNNQDVSSSRALSKAGEIVKEAAINLTENTKEIRDISKKIANLNK